MFVSARSFEEYRAMFALTGEDLALRILDCPGGAAGFVAEAGARGVDAVAVDPQYGEDRGRVGELALREVEYRHGLVSGNAADYVWTWFGDPDRYTRLRLGAARAFAADLARRPDRYVAGSLPSLPFADREFDLVLSSHLLFTYGARLDETFHWESLVELVRVARHQVRVFPTRVYAGDRRYDALDRLRERLADLGVPSRVERVEYEFEPGADEMLVLECADRGALPRRRSPAGRPNAWDPVRWRHLDVQT